MMYLKFCLLLVGLSINQLFSRVCFRFLVWSRYAIIIIILKSILYSKLEYIQVSLHIMVSTDNRMVRSMLFTTSVATVLQ